MNNSSDISETENGECSLTDDEIQHSYNLSLHIVSIFVLLAVSFLGASISVASTRIKRLHINPIIINTGKFFGSGVVLATGFIHILPDAMETLSDPCLPESWNVYGAYGGLFAMLAALAMQLIEFLAHQRYRSMKHKHSDLKTKIEIQECNHEHAHDKGEECENSKPTNNKIDQSAYIEHVHQENENHQKKKHVHGHIDHIENVEQINDKTEEVGKVEEVTEMKKKSKKKKTVNVEIHILEQRRKSSDKIEESEPVQQTNSRTELPSTTIKTHKHRRTSEHIKEDNSEPSTPDDKDQPDCVAIDIVHVEPPPEPLELCEGSAHFHGAAFQNENDQNKISTYLLELGIALHSILIGLTLGTTSESFVALFIALCFHQFFEAIALGAQIAHLKTTSIKSAIFMILFFSFTTPVGIAIGIGIHSGTYNPKSVSSLLVTGILDSLSAGVLIYVALVNLITAEMGANAHAFYSLSTRLKFLYFIALYLGVACMAVIGRWA